MLGPHKVGDDVEIRVFRPDARVIEVVLDREPDKRIAAKKTNEEGFFRATVPGAERDVPYRLCVVKLNGSEEITRDAYRSVQSWATSICIYSAKDNTGKSTKNLARICGRSAMRPAFILQFGLRTRNASASLGISTIGMAASIRCGSY